MHPPSDSSQLSLLLIEDSPSDAFLLRRVLSKAHPGCRIVQCTSGEEGQKYLIEAMNAEPRQPVNAILLDLHLPGMSGWDFLAWIASLPLSPPVIALVGSTDGAEAGNLLDAGARAAIVKPGTPEAFRALFQRLEGQAA